MESVVTEHRLSQPETWMVESRWGYEVQTWDYDVMQEYNRVLHDLVAKLKLKYDCFVRIHSDTHILRGSIVKVIKFDPATRFMLLLTDAEKNSKIELSLDRDDMELVWIRGYMGRIVRKVSNDITPGVPRPAPIPKLAPTPRDKTPKPEPKLKEKQPLFDSQGQTIKIGDVVLANVSNDTEMTLGVVVAQKIKTIVVAPLQPNGYHLYERGSIAWHRKVINTPRNVTILTQKLLNHAYDLKDASRYRKAKKTLE